MNGLDSLLEQSVINFPRPIDSEEAKSLMILLADKLPAHIGYSCKTGVDIQPNGKPHELKLEETDLKLEGSIRRKSNLATAFFKLEKDHSHEGLGKYSYLRFHTIPGCTLGDDPNEIEIWDRVRVLIKDYFS